MNHQLDGQNEHKLKVWPVELKYYNYLLVNSYKGHYKVQNVLYGYSIFFSKIFLPFFALTTFLLLATLILVTSVLLLILASVLVLLLHLLVRCPLLKALLLLTARVCGSTTGRNDHLGSCKNKYCHIYAQGMTMLSRPPIDKSQKC